MVVNSHYQHYISSHLMKSVRTTSPEYLDETEYRYVGYPDTVILTVPISYEIASYGTGKANCLSPSPENGNFSYH